MDDHRQFADLLEAWADAIVSNDPERIGAFAEPDWILVGETGIYEGRDLLGSIADGTITHSWMEFEVHRVRIDGDVATVIARGRNRGTFHGEPFALDEWTSDVFLRRDDGWKCAVTHLTSAVEAEPG